MTMALEGYHLRSWGVHFNYFQRFTVSQQYKKYMYVMSNKRMDLAEEPNLKSHNWLPLIDISMEMNWGHPIPGKVAGQQASAEGSHSQERYRFVC